MEPAAKRVKTAEKKSSWDHDCHDVVSFRLIESTKEIEIEEEIALGGIEFNAEYFHQLFGEEETIKGYEDLQINLWMSTQTYHSWLDISFSRKKLGSDKIEKVFNEAFPGGLFRTKQEFINAVTKTARDSPDLSKSGEHLATVPLKGDAKVLVKKFNLATSEKYIKDLHQRFEPLLLFFVDGASSIEQDEPRWDVLMLIQPTPKGNQLLGIATMYSFYAFPEGRRLRLSQMLVLPPYQQAGLGKKLLQVAYDMARSGNCSDLTIEDPTPGFQSMREKLEVEELLQKPWATSALSECAQAILEARAPSFSADLDRKLSSREGESRGPGDASLSSDQPDVALYGAPTFFVAHARQELKIHKRQAGLLWEALLFLQSGLWLQARGRAVLEALITARIESQIQLSASLSNTLRKRVVHLLNADPREFIVMRVCHARGGASMMQEGVAEDGAGPSAKDGLASYKEQTEKRVSEMLEERIEQLSTLRQLMDGKKRVAGGQ